MKTKIAITFLFLSTVCVARAFANPGDLDPTFGTGGTFVDAPALYPCFGMYPWGSTLQSDGKLVVVGKLYNQCGAGGFSDDPINLRRVLLRRYNPNGTPDTGFGVDGFAVAELPFSTNVYGEGFDVLVQPDGRILVAGSKAARSGTTAAVWRFTPDGELDSTFGNNGVVTFTSSGTYNASDKLALWNGYVLVAGYSTPIGVQESIWVRKLNQDGSPHVWFGSGGKITTGLTTELGGTTLAIHPVAGNIFVGGKVNNTAVVAKYFSSGTVFYNFGTNGRVVLPDCAPGGGYISRFPIVPLDLRFQSTGKLLVASKMALGGFSLTLGIHRLTAGGWVDPTFVDPNVAGSCDGLIDGSTWIRVLPGDNFYAGDNRHFADGAKDPTFVTSLYAGGSGEIQTDGKIVHVVADWHVLPGEATSDARVKLFRLLP